MTVVGDTMNFAARLQSLAAPSSAIMSEGTHRLVEGLVEASFIGERQIKGKADAQKAYRLDGIRERVRGFDAKVDRGLTRYVGRDRELETLERCLEAISAGLQVFDIVGEPGIGKSRLVHEFLGQIVKERARVLTGSCTPDGQQTPFRAFIEIVRGAFRLSPSDSEAVVARKLDEGLQGLGLQSPENLGLLLNLLGLKPPEGAWEGLDAVLIGLRTRELLQRLAQARSRLTPLILVFEDLHWVDSASQDLLAKIVAIDEPIRLLILHTRRLEYSPPWASQPRVTRLAMEPLSARETARIAEARIGVDQLPEALARLIAAKAEGNALFAEEIASFLVERGMVRRTAAGLDFDPAAVAAALPESVQSLLASRVDRLAPADRNLLQAAAVVGRRFDPDLVAAVSGVGGGARTSFAAMEALDLVHRVEGSSDHVFKHSLVRDALYNGLLSGLRATLHLKVAEELERSGGNRLVEIAESLAHHYAHTSRADRAFAYLSLAGDKSLDVYSITEAEQYYRQALELYETQRTCANHPCIVRVVVRLLEVLHQKCDYREIERVASRFMWLLKESGETPELVLAFLYQQFSLSSALEFRTAHSLVVEALKIGERLGDLRACTFARSSLLQVRTVLGLDSLEAADRMKAQLMQDSLSLRDNHVLNWAYFSVAWDYMYRGLYKEAREAAMQLIASGGERNDPRAIGFANVILGWINILSDVPEAAIANADECLRVAVTPFDRLNGEMIKAVSSIVHGRWREGLAQMDKLIPKFEQLGLLYAIQHGPRGAALAMSGRISEGIKVIKEHIVRLDSAGDRTIAAWTRITLAEIYIQILSGKDKPPATVILKNFLTILGARMFGVRRARALLREAEAHKQLSERGVIFARINLNLGVLSVMENKRAEAKRYLEKARIAAENQGADKLRQKIDATLAELQ